MFKLRVSTLLICCLFAVSVNAKITIMTENFAPFSYYGENGELTGIGVEIVEHLMEKLNINEEIQVLPWSRAIKELEFFPNRALFCVARTPSRNDKFEWVGPIFSDGLYLFHSKQFDSSGEDLESAKRWENIAVTANYPEHQTLLDLGFENLWITNKPTENARLLMYDRVTAMVAGELAIQTLLESQGADTSAFVRSQIRLFDIDLYIAFSKGTNPKVLNQWQQALEDFQSSPEYQQIRKGYTIGQ